MDNPFAWIVVAYAALILVVLVKWWSESALLRRHDLSRKRADDTPAPATTKEG